MKKIYLLVLLCLATVSAFALNGPSTPGGPGSATPYTGTFTYCVGAAATPITYNYSECSIGVGAPTGVNCTATWYYNTTNTNVVSGSSVVVAGPTSFTSAAGTNGDLPTFTPVTTSAGTYYYFCVVTWTDPGTCASPFTTGTQAVTINPAPAAIGGASTVCVGSTITLSDATSGGTWTSSDLSVATVGLSNGVVTGAGAGSADITFTITSTGCTAVSTITVNPTPAAITGTASMCLGSSTALADATPGGNWTSSNGAIATVSASGVVSSVAAGNATISYTLSTGCTRTQVVTVYATPAAITGTTTVCTGLTTTLSNTTSGGTWSTSDATIAVISSSGVVTPVAPGTADITYTLASGCFTTTTITVNASPAAIGGTPSVCNGSTTTLTDADAGGIWSSSNSSVASVNFSTGVVTGMSVGTATITYTLGSGCRAVVTFTVNTAPSAIGGTMSVCLGSTSTLTNSVSGGAWTSSNTSVATIGVGTGVVTSVTTGNSDITYTLGNGCFSTSTVTVSPLPGAITGTASVCIGLTTTLSDPDAGGTWTSASTSVATIGASNGVVTGVTANTTTITYTLPSGCRTTTVVTVNPLPSPLTGTASVCEAATTTLSSTTTGGVWTTSDPSVATVGVTGVVTGVAAGNAFISYTIGTGCYRTANVTVNPLPSASTGVAEVCVGSTTTLSNGTAGGTWISSSTSTATVGSATGVVSGVNAATVNIAYRLSTGCQSVTVVTVDALPSTILGAPTMCVGATFTFTDATSGGVWSNDDGTIASISSTGVVTALSAGVVHTSYTLATGCYRVVTTTVNPVPAAITGSSPICPATTLALSDATGGGTWSSNSTGIATVGSATGVVTGVNGGTAIISYILSSTGCYQTTVVTVNPLPNSITGTATMCVGANTTLNSVTAGGAWTSSDGSIATVVAGTGVVTGVAAGVADITYTLGTGCYRIRTVTVNGLPSAIAGTLEFCQGSTSALSSAPGGGTWTSSTGSVATVGASTGVVTGVAAGNANITYTLSTGCRATATVTIDPLPATIIGSNNVCLGLTTALSDATGGGVWSSSDATVAPITGTGVVTGASVGVATITYQLGTGCYRTFNMTVNPLPAAIGGTMEACVGATTTLTDATAGGVWSSGATGIASVGASTGVVTGVAAGNANITYTLSTSCIAVATVTIDALPAAITGTAGVCVGSTTNLSSATPGGVWSSNDATIASVVAGTGVVTGVSAGVTTITYTLGTGCYRTVNVTVNNLPAAITGTGVACVGATTVLSNTTPAGTWTSGNTAIATVGASTGVVTGVSAGNTDITYSVGTGCFVTFTVTINPLPTVITGPGSVCVGSTINLSSTPAGGNWSSSNGAIASVIAATGDVTGNAPGNATITYQIGTGCYRTANVTVNALPAAISGASTVCVGSTITLTDATSGGTWSSSNSAVATVGSANGVVGGVSGGVADITYTITSTGCIAVSTITVNSLPSTITGTASVCVGSTTALSNATAGGVWSSSNTAVATVTAAGGVVTGVSGGTSVITYLTGAGCFATKVVTVHALPGAIAGSGVVCEASTTNLTDVTPGGTWISSDITIATIGATGLVTGVAAGNADITYTITSTGCYAVKTVTVNARPAAITGTGTVCVGSVTALSNATPGGTWSSSTASVASVDVSGNVTGVIAGTAYISYTMATGCYRTTIVTVYALPSAISGTAIVCEGATATLSDATSSGTWSTASANATIGSSNGIVTGVTAGNADVTYTLSTGCFVTKTVTVNSSPAAITGTFVVCAGSTTALSSAPAGGIWSSSNSGIASVNFSTGVVTGAGAGVATISYTLGNGCRKTASVTVNPNPAAITGTAAVCQGSITTLFNTVAGGTWSSSDGTVAPIGVSTGVVTGLSAGTATITYQLAAGCFVTRDVTVNALPGAITGTTVVCDGATSALSSSTVGGTWTSAGPSIATVGSASGILTGINPGTTTVTYTLATGCKVTTGVTVNTTPAAIGGTLSMCNGNSVTLTNSTTGGGWTSSDGTVATIGAGTGVVASVGPGTSTISYTLGSGCYSVAEVTVYPVPAAITGTGAVCVGGTTSLSNATAGGSWSSSSTAVASVGLATGVVTGNAAGTATITYTLGGGCNSTTVITVNALPAAISGASTVCVGSSVAYTSTTGGGTWSSSDATIALVGSSSGVVTGMLGGTASITYTLATGCFRTKVVTVNDLPAGITGTLTVCDGSTTALSSATSGGTWVSSSTSIASVVSTTGVVTGNNPGTATITYTLGTGCRTTAVVTVNALPAAITGTATVCIGFTTTFSDITAGGVWSSSGTNASVDAAGVVTGLSAGTEGITYTLASGCFVVRTVTVNALPSAITGTASVCASGSTTTLSNATAGGNWTSSSASIASVGLTTGVVTGVNPGTATITYTLSTGCNTTTVVTVNALPAAITGTTSVCLGSTTTLADATAGGAWTSGNIAVATIGTAGDVFGASVGTAPITYTLGTGCRRTTTVTVMPLPAAISGPTDVCVGSTIALTDATTGGTWSSSSTATATISTTGVVTGVFAGVANMTYTLSTGCYVITPITVNPLPAAIVGANSVCVGSTTTMTDATPGGVWSNNNGLATVGAAGDVTGVSAGTTIISYTLGTGCYKTKVVTVNPLPAVITGSLSVCVGSTTNLSSATPSGTWSSMDNTIATVSTTTGVVTGVSANTVDIVYTLSTGCTRSANVTVNPLPASITGTMTMCVGATSTLGDATAGGAWTSSTPGVASVDVAGVVTGASAGTAIITYTLATSCYRTAMVTVNGLPTAIGGSLSVCEGGTTTLTSTPLGGTWSSSNLPVATIGTSTGVVSGLTAGTSTIVYTLSTGCSQSVEVTVNPSPAPISGASSVCIGFTTTMTDAVVGGVWSTSNATVAPIDAVGVVTGNATGTATITYTLGTCRVTKAFTVFALPNVITGTAQVCEGGTTVLSDATIGGTWSSSSTTTATVGSTSGVVTGVNAGVATITYTAVTGCYRTTPVTVNITPTAITGTMVICAGDQSTLANTVPGGVWYSSNTAVATVDAGGVVTGVGAGNVFITYTLTTGCSRVANMTINPVPSVISGSHVVCEGATTNLSVSPAGGIWSSSNTGVAIVSSTGVVSGVAFGTSTISYTLSTGCGRSIVMSVNQAPAVITGTGVLCAGQTTTLSNAVTGGAWNSSTLSVATVDASGVVTGAGAGTATITYTLGTGCSRTTIVTVNATPSPIAGVLYVCEGLTTNLSSTPAGGVWSVFDPSVAVISASGVVTGSVAGTTGVSYTLSSGCYSTAIVTVYVNPPAITGSGTVCAGSTTTLSNAITGGNWTSSTTSVATAGFSTGVISGIATGTSTITYTLTSGCKTTTVVTVSPLPAAIGGITNLCIGGVTTLTDATPGGNWTSLDPSVATVGAGTGIVTGFATGTATISYTIGTGCARTTVVTVNPLPAAISGTMSVCVGASTFLTDATTGGTWSSSTPSIATIGSTTGIVNGVAAGTATITYTLSTGCRSTAVMTVDPIPAAITGTPTVCVGNTTILSTTTFGGTWSSSNPALASVDASGVVTGNANGIATISYAVSSGCARTINVTVNPGPSPITGTTSICIGSSTTLFNSTTGGSWTSGTPGVATVGLTSGVVTSVAAGTTTISYSMSTGCRSLTVVTVFPLPSSIGGSTVICSGSTTTLTNAVTGGTWSSSTSAIATVDVTTGVVSGISTGTAVITYSLGSGCRTTTVVTVNTVPAAITGVANVCELSTTSLSDATSGGIWSSSNTTIATVSSTGLVNGISAGTATISYTMVSGCARTQVVTVNPNPPAILGYTSICLGSSDTLSNTMTGGLWNSSNPAVASIGISTGIVDGLSAGTARITYTMGTGCFTYTDFTVNALPAPITGPGIVCEGNTGTLSNSIGGGTWLSQDPSVATIGITNGIVNGITPGYDTIRYIVGGGCSSWTVITVNPTPDINPASTAICVGSDTVFSSSYSGGTWTSSNTSIVSIGLSSGVAVGLSAGSAHITYALGAGCYTISMISVNPMPGAITGVPNVCSGQTTALHNSLAGGTWTSGDVTIASVNSSTGVVTGGASGNTSITYTLPGGCSVDYPITVNASPAPITVVGSLVAPLQVCAGSTLSLDDATSGGIWSSTAPSIAPIGLSSGVVSGINVGTTTISYTVTSTGCASFAVLTVNPLPAAITGVMNVCQGATTTLSSTTISGTWYTGSISIVNVGVGTGIVTGLSTGLATVTYQLPTGCYTTADVGVNPLPDPISGASVLCAGSTTTMSSTTLFGTWSSSNTAVATAGSVSGAITGVSAGTATITYMMGTGCYVTQQLTVNPVPGPLAGTPYVCVGSAIYLSSTSPGGTWVSGNTAVATVDATGNVFGVATGTSAISYTLGSGCMSTVEVTVEPTPGPITGTLLVCQGSSTTLGNTFTGGVWTSADVTIATAGSASGIVTGIATGTTHITYASPVAGCHVTAIVTVQPLPSSIIGLTDVCVGSTISLLNATTGGTWSSSNISVATIGTSGVVTGVTAGTATMSYSVASGCAATSVITVHPLAFADTITGPTSVCLGDSITLSNTVTGGTWTSSDTTILGIDSTTGVATGNAAGTATVTYTVTNLCGTATAVRTVIVNPAADAGSITGSTSICIGFTSTVVSTVSGGTWSSTDTTVATVSSDGIVTGVHAGTVTINYQVTTLCGTSWATINITVNGPAPIANIVIHPDSNICSNVMYQNFGTAHGQPAGVTYSWTAVNAVVNAISPDRQNAIISFPDAGVAIVKLTTNVLASGCTTTDSFIATIGTTVASDPEVKYYNSLLICTDNTADSYQWGYDDATTLDSTLLVHETHQDYYVPDPDFEHKLYWVMTQRGGCLQKSYYNAPLSSATIVKTNEIRMFPNPADSRINVEIGGVTGDVNIKVFDMLGKSVYDGVLSNGKGTIVVANLASGVYSVLFLQDGNKLGVRNFVKQ